MKRPNIVFYFSDQQRFDSLGCYGQKLPVSPNLDALAAKGTIFDNAFTCQPVCGPARACLQDGRYATENGCFTNGISLNCNDKHIADYFNEAGYETAYVGKWHLASDRNKGINYKTSAIPRDRRAGYKDYWVASDVLEFTSHGYNGFVFDDDCNRLDFVGYRADAINNYAVEFIHRYSGEKPFFLFISQIEPHHQNDVDKFEGPDNSKNIFKDFEAPLDLEKGKGNWEEEYPSYLGCCNSLDKNVGILIDALMEKNILDDTIFIYCSDHGCHFKTRNMEYKRSCHDSSIHIPLIMCGPGIDKGRRIGDLVGLIDLPATLLDFADIKIPSYFQGQSLKCFFNDKDVTERLGVFIQISESQIGRAVRTKRFMYSVRAVGDAWKQKGSMVYYEDVLYDLEDDPYEHNNLVEDNQYQAIREQLRTLLISFMIKAGETKPEILPGSAKPEELKNDGYYY